MAKKSKSKKSKKSKSKTTEAWTKRASSTLGSIAIGTGALVFAFALVFSDSMKGDGSNTLQRLMVGSQAQGGNGTGGQQQGGNGLFNLAPQTLSPERRLEVQPAPSNNAQVSLPQVPPPSGNAAGQIRNDTSKNSIESYLDSAWSSAPQPQSPQPQQSPMMQAKLQKNLDRIASSPLQTPQRRTGMMPQGMMQQRGMVPQGMMQRQNMMMRSNAMRGQMYGQLNSGVGQPGFGANPAMGGMMANNQQPQNKSLLQMLFGGGDNKDGSGTNKADSVRGDVEYQVELARTKADEASTMMDRARDADNEDDKRQAASEARYYANEARVAADRAASRAAGIDDLQGLVSEALAQANRANSCAQYAADALSGW